MSDAPSTILFRNTMRVTDGHVTEYRAATMRAVEFAREHGPQLMVDVFFSTDRMLAYSFQLYPDSDAIRTHWRLSDPYIHDVMSHCTVQSLDIYGEPDQEILDALTGPTGGTDVPITLHPRMTGFLRPDLIAG